MAAPRDKMEVPIAFGERVGFDVDPYADECQLEDIHSPYIPFHNYRQIHVSEVAFYAGWSAVKRSDAPCPPMWGDVGHYWAAAALAGYIASEFLTKEGVANKIAAAAVVLASLKVSGMTDMII